MYHVLAQVGKFAEVSATLRVNDERTLTYCSNIVVLEFEQVYLKSLPSALSYERSYMHRDAVTHILATK